MATHSSILAGKSYGQRSMGSQESWTWPGNWTAIAMGYYWGLERNPSTSLLVSDSLLSLWSQEDLIILSANRSLKILFWGWIIIRNQKNWDIARKTSFHFCLLSEQCLSVFIALKTKRKTQLFLILAKSIFIPGFINLMEKIIGSIYVLKGHISDGISSENLLFIFKDYCLYNEMLCIYHLLIYSTNNCNNISVWKEKIWHLDPYGSQDRKKESHLEPLWSQDIFLVLTSSNRGP